MSDHIPFEIQSEIMNTLPVKSLLRFRSICKQWKSLIDSSDFIAHLSSQQQQQHLLVSYYDNDYEQKYVSIVDDHTFPQQKVFLTVPQFSWLGVVVPAVSNMMFETTLGFGVCRKTRDPKIVKIKYISWLSSVDINATYIPSQVEVFTLSTGAWRSPFGSNLPRKSIWFHDFHPFEEVVIDGVLYWLAIDRNTMTGRIKLIVSFDMTSEEFREITLPGDLSDANSHIMSYLGNSLVVCKDVAQDINGDLCIWMMRGGVSNSFTKLFSITLNGHARLRGFRKSGEPIIAIQGKCGPGRLAVYEPYSKRIDYLGIDGSLYSLEVYPYMETLFLLDQPDNKVYR
ncbi:putative F-box domain-containing protein [Helianthus anomalus]